MTREGSNRIKSLLGDMVEILQFVTSALRIGMSFYNATVLSCKLTVAQLVLLQSCSMDMDPSMAWLLTQVTQKTSFHLMTLLNRCMIHFNSAIIDRRTEKPLAVHIVFAQCYAHMHKYNENPGNLANVISLASKKRRTTMANRITTLSTEQNHHYHLESYAQRWNRLGLHAQSGTNTSLLVPLLKLMSNIEQTSRHAITRVCSVTRGML